MPDQMYHNVLIIKPSSLGDIVHALPAVIELRRAMPAVRLTWLVRNHFASLLQDISEIDNVLLFDRRALAAWFYSPQSFRALLDFRKSLKNSRFDLVLDLQGLLRSALFALMTGCNERIGLAEAREGARLFYTRSVPPPPDSPHILDYYYAVLRTLGISPQKNNFRLSASPQARASAAAKLNAAGLVPKKFLVLVPGSAHISKCWPPERFARVAGALHDRFGFSVAAIGAAGEKDIIRQIQRHCDLPIVDLSGQTSLPELTAVFEQSAAVLSNDTGPGHMAAAVAVPLVMIFGRTNPLRLGPYKRPDCIAAVDIEHRGNSIDSQNPGWRIEHVSVDMVLHKITSQLA